MGPDGHVVHYWVSAGRFMNVVCVTEHGDWTSEGWTEKGNVADAMARYEGWHPQVRRLIASFPETYIWALQDRLPLALWSEGRLTLLGDACHPMVPFMAQGACQAFEDAVVLSRVIDAMGDTRIESALSRYEQIRRERTARIQRASRSNEWLKVGGNADWVYGYDAWSTPLT